MVEATVSAILNGMGKGGGKGVDNNRDEKEENRVLLE